MFNGITQYLWIVFIILGFFVFRRGLSGNMRYLGPTLVLRRFEFREAVADGVFLRIVGRPAGLISWLMTILQIEDDTTLEVSGDAFMVRSSGLHGQTQQFTPLRSIATTHCGYIRPIVWLLLGGIFAISGVFEAWSERSLTVLLAALFLASICFIVYWLNRKLRIWVQTHGSETLGIVFKPSAIERVTVDLQQSIKVIMAINRRVIEAMSKFSLARSVPAAQNGNVDSGGNSGSPLPALERHNNICHKCNAALSPDVGYCTQCGTPRR